MTTKSPGKQHGWLKRAVSIVVEKIMWMNMVEIHHTHVKKNIIMSLVLVYDEYMIIPIF